MSIEIQNPNILKKFIKVIILFYFPLICVFILGNYLLKQEVAIQSNYNFVFNTTYAAQIAFLFGWLFLYGPLYLPFLYNKGSKISIKRLWVITVGSIFVIFILLIVIWGLLSDKGFVQDDSEPASLFAVLLFAMLWNLIFSSLVIFIIYLSRLVRRMRNKNSKQTQSSSQTL